MDRGQKVTGPRILGVASPRHLEAPPGGKDGRTSEGTRDAG